MSDLYEIYSRIISLTIIIISLDEILLSYIANTSRMHASTHAYTHTRAHTYTHTPPSPFRLDSSVAPKRDEVNAPFRLFRWHSWPVAGSFKLTHSLATRFPEVLDVFRI